jgi:hypothetical protein
MNISYAANYLPLSEDEGDNTGQHIYAQFDALGEGVRENRVLAESHLLKEMASPGEHETGPRSAIGGGFEYHLVTDGRAEEDLGVKLCECLLEFTVGKGSSSVWGSVEGYRSLFRHSTAARSEPNILTVHGGKVRRLLKVALDAWPVGSTHL